METITDETTHEGDDDVQPREFPLGFDEWAEERRRTHPIERVLVAGFAHTVRAAGKLRSLQLRTEWDAQFNEFSGAAA